MTLVLDTSGSMEGEGTPCPPNVLRLSVGLEDPDDLTEVGATIILANTYHLYLRPGHERIDPGARRPAVAAGPGGELGSVAPAWRE